MPGSPLEAVMSHEVWQEIYDRLVELIESHRTTLIMVNTRRLAERMAHQLSERLGAEHVAAHHGSLSKEARLDAEERLREGKLKVLVATASLELGIDIGHVDLVCQISSPQPHRDAAAARRALGPHRAAACRRAASSRSRATTWSSARRWCARCATASSTASTSPDKPLDVLAQQIVAEVGARRNGTRTALFELFMRSAYPYRDLDAPASSTKSSRCSRSGYATKRGRRGR